MKILLKSATALSLILAATSYAAAQEPGQHHRHHQDPANQSFIIQSGNGNWGFVSQDHDRRAQGENRAATFQKGNNNFSFTKQEIANPFYNRREDGNRDGEFGQGKNNSLVYQGPGKDGKGGNGNGAMVFQGAVGGGENNQLTLQTGNGNFAATAQISSRSVSNSSFTGQFGNKNVAGTFQH